MASNAVEVYVKLPSGKSSRYDILPSQQLSYLCEKVASEAGVRVGQVRLKFQGKTLDNNKTVGQYGVRVETILKAEILIPQDLDLNVHMTDFKIEEVIISNLEPVSALFKCVAEKSEIPINKLQLTVEGRALASSNIALKDAGIVRGTSLSASVKEIVTPSAERNKINSAENTPLGEEARQAVLSSFDARGRQVEVAFSFDTTGSMYSYLTEVRTKLRECCTRLIQDIPNIRISIIAQGDYCDSTSLYAVKMLDLTSDVQALLDFAQNAEATSGGDTPECYELVLKKAQHLDWSEDSAKALVVIGDLYPHPPSYTDQDIYWKDELDLLTGMGVKVYGVQAGINDQASHFYKEIAEVSGGCYLNLKHLSVITDMFLAVCYNETNDDMLEDFEQELVTTGNMTEQKQEMISQIKLKQKKEVGDNDNSTKNKTEKEKNVPYPWYDRSLDHGQVQYKYEADTDKWVQLSLTQRVRTSPPITSHITRAASSRSSQRKNLKKRCSIM